MSLPNQADFLPRKEALTAIQKAKSAREEDQQFGAERERLQPKSYVKLSGHEGPGMRLTLERIAAGEATAEQKYGKKQKVLVSRSPWRP